jgi:hypothetical protein
VIVSTPQDVALVDARKGVGMFHKVSIPASPFSPFSLTRNASAEFHCRS